MDTQRVLCSVAMVLVLAGCSSPKTLSKQVAKPSLEKISPDDSKQQMQLYIASAGTELVQLEQQATKPCIQGQLSIAQAHLTRATAEHQAGMDKDAFITLVELDRQIRKIRCINSYINGQLGCRYTQKKTVLKRWYDEGDYHQCPQSFVNPQLAASQHQIITETLFDFDQDEIKPIYFKSLNKLANLAKSYPKSTLIVSGHTDSLGSNNYNIDLSQKRAENVVKFFTDEGVNASQIVMKAQGEEHTRELETNKVSRVFNRYTSITLLLDISDKS